MDAIEKRARELFAAAKALYNATIGDPSVTIRCQSGASRDAVAAAGERLRLALLDQDHTSAAANHAHVIPPSAAGAHEVQAKAVDVGLDSVEPGERFAAADALEHGAGVRPEGDGQATADHSAHDLKMVERVAKAMQAAEQSQTGWAWEDCSPIEVEGWTDLARAAIAALTPPEGYVLVPVEPTEEMIGDGAESRPMRPFTPLEDWEAFEAMTGCEQGWHKAKLCWFAMLAARPDAPS
ncbi:TPA: hypothetical protein ACKP7M_000556 [Stenotrophomonas maltophilia]|nr:hypothetical protein [Stenotrophomonas maltophilia]HEL7760448.1 hypothetical protein [Stenotrophomonas maltophilia]